MRVLCGATKELAAKGHRLAFQAPKIKGEPTGMNIAEAGTTLEHHHQDTPLLPLTPDAP